MRYGCGLLRNQKILFDYSYSLWLKLLISPVYTGCKLQDLKATGIYIQLLEYTAQSVCHV